MKKDLLLISEKESMMAPLLRYTAVMPPYTFVESEIFTVFPELRARFIKDHPANSDHHHNQQTTISPMVIITFQMSNFEYSEGSQDYVDRSRESFVEFAKEIQKRLVPDGWWADFCDPATGLPMLTTASSVLYNETDAIEQLLSLEHMYVNENRSLVHPIFGDKVYVASAVVYGGSANQLKELLEEL